MNVSCQSQGNYCPTKDELLVLYRYWYETLLEMDLDWFMFGVSSCIRRRPIAGRRLNEIEAILNEKDLRKIANEVEGQQRNAIGKRYWEIFKSGNRADWDQVQDEVLDTVNAAAASARSDA